MLATTGGLALFPIRTSTRLRFDVNHVGVPTPADDLVGWPHAGETNVHILAQRATGSWFIDRVAACLECSRWLGVYTRVGEFLSTIAFLAAFSAAPVACAVFIAFCEVDLIR
ncbi:hypothetical protein C496_23648 [Natronorubrum tibetense GA33]|uniref:Uncharacterized protein n=1 Tax=Natronorubrum tibetense GA33 TaxID=1114856 RepID=L9VEI3_9EURY|nr:hypothetical protein C496_23648 [Natronorubrum tibetense GA33]